MAIQVAERVAQALATGMSSASELATSLKVSQPSISRAINELSETNRILRLGNTRGARYGLRHNIADIGSSWPLYRVAADATVAHVATVHALAANEFHVEPHATFARARMSGLSNGLPYYLQDQRPNGFLGRGVPHHYPELNLPQRVNDWSDEHFLRYFTKHGGNAVGDLILGHAALNEWLASRDSQALINSQQREQSFTRLAEMAMTGGMPGSSAHGEHPKFAALIDAAQGPQQVLVKFSPPRHSPVGQRWSDLLVAEHIAHRILNERYDHHGVRACQSELLMTDARTFLEVQRFDRCQKNGRIGVTSLFAIDADLYGRLDTWTAAGARLHADGHIDASTLRALRFAAAFGSLIGNTDRHFGNFAFFDDYTGSFRSAPIYDMLPMYFAPEHDQLLTRTFQAPPVTADTLDVWPEARTLAIEYWHTLEMDARISTDFRLISRACRASIESGIN